MIYLTVVGVVTNQLFKNLKLLIDCWGKFRDLEVSKMFNEMGVP